MPWLQTRFLDGNPTKHSLLVENLAYNAFGDRLGRHLGYFLKGFAIIVLHPVGKVLDILLPKDRWSSSWSFGNNSAVSLPISNDI